MEPFVFSLVMAWALTRYAATDLVATVKGTESPRYRERHLRLRQQHERHMARVQHGPTIGQAVSERIAHWIAQPRPPHDRSRQRPFRRFLGEWWDDSWNHATERRRQHHERKQAGDLPRQRAARAARDTFRRWQQHRRRAEPRSAGPVPPETPAERTGPIHVVAERLPLPAGTPDTPFESSIPEERNTTAMPDNNIAPAQADPAPGGEVINIATALDYTRSMREQFSAAASHAEAVTAQTRQMSDWSAQAATSAETALAGITAGEVTGEAVDRLTAAHEQMTAAADCVRRAADALQLAQEQFIATTEGFAIAHAAFDRQSTVAEAYAANPDAGSKQFNTLG